jgi:hypothetical protein
MIMTLITLFVVGALTYLWVTRGFMSALIHMICVIVAGAIAFGVWEPVSMQILKIAPDRGFATFVGSMAWGLGLALPFAITLAVLRLAVDSLLPANAQCDTVVDYVGGGVCGFISGVISAGIIVLSIGFLRLDPQFLGHSPLVYSSTARGSLERNPDKFVPWVDKLTASLYTQLSLTTLRTSSPLGYWHPDFDTLPSAMRQTFDGRSRNTLKPQDFDVIGWYNVGDPQRPASLTPLMVDHWNENPQPVADLDGTRITNGYLTGTIVRFRAGARERGGFIAVGNGQIRLVCRREGSEDTKALHPVAVVTRTVDPVRIDYARFRFDSDGMYVASVGGEADAVMAFEFTVPSGYRPLALYVKGVRFMLPARGATETFPSVAERDRAIREGKFDGMGNVGVIRDEHGVPLQRPEQQAHWRAEPVQVNSNLGFMIQKGTERGLRVTQLGRGWAIEEGEGTYSRAEATRGSQADFRLQINRFAVTDDTAMVRVDASPADRTPQVRDALERADRNAPPELIDTNGRRYPAVGFIYDDRTNYRVRYSRGQPIRAMAELPQVSRNTPDRVLTLLFVVSRGVEIREFRIGGELIEMYDPPLATEHGR